ncbi:hypothetical protein PPACK8108_LOCUS6013 [Phakopsora pachyrhizi]|uniref:Uncharacterized protein n=1 Tax=Phakopsora pachyrhizi TaxID=170000 RepID=A0AAV0ARN6_PHAPC|nr:hypothetical protein PPACK8108_LOCUS6013 [Phakopsora pachyrhizi]
MSSPNPEHQQLNQLPKTPSRRSFNCSSKPSRKIPAGSEFFRNTHGTNDDNYHASFSISIKHCHKVGVHTKKQALDYIRKSVKFIKKGPIVEVMRPLSEEALEVLLIVVLAHVPAYNINLYPKALYLAVMA